MSRDRDFESIINAQPSPPGRNGNGRWKVDPRLAMSIIGWVTTIIISWGVAWGGFNARMAVVEVRQQENERLSDLRQQETDRRLQRIEAKVDELVRRP